MWPDNSFEMISESDTGTTKEISRSALLGEVRQFLIKYNLCVYLLRGVGDECTNRIMYEINLDKFSNSELRTLLGEAQTVVFSNKNGDIHFSLKGTYINTMEDERFHYLVTRRDSSGATSNQGTR